MKKIIHMSDLHVGFADFDVRFQLIIDNLIQEKGHEAHEYVVLITGDLVDDANNLENYKVVREKLNILRAAGFGHVLVIPGNHDYGTGYYGKKKFVKIFQETFYDGVQGYPRKNIIQDVAFIGLDSMAEEVNWYDGIFAEGELGREQLARLDHIFDDHDVKGCLKRVVYLHHNPISWRPVHQLKDARKLKRVLKRVMQRGISVDALLFGHNHEGKAHHGRWGVRRLYDAGTATLKPRPKYVDWSPWFQIRSCIRVIDIAHNDVQRDCEIPLLPQDL